MIDSAEQFDRAAKKAIKQSGRDAGNAYREMLRDRFLCRVFSDPEERFILKGGSGLLARIPDARATKDIDFAINVTECADDAVAALNALVKKDLGDFCNFMLTSRVDSLDENGYSRLLKLRYAAYIGDEEKDPILIDLSLDCVTTLPPERINPANRIALDGIETHDYLAYPLPDQLADKLCAIMEMQPGGLPSSRMKDLVDVVAYTTHEHFQLDQLAHAIRSECAKRSMALPSAFKAPEMWRTRFRTFAKQHGVPGEYISFDNASQLASSFYNPALREFSTGDLRWDYQSRKWTTL